MQSGFNYIYQKLSPNDENKNDGAVKLKTDKPETSMEDKAEPLTKEEFENPEIESDDVIEGEGAQSNIGFKDQQQSIENEQINEVRLQKVQIATKK